MPLTDEIAQQGVDREGALFNSRQALQSWWQTGDECQIHSQQSDWQDFFVCYVASSFKSPVTFWPLAAALC